jgi:nucleotide-binding universal stress UspA family protein
MYEKILVPLDSSELAECALPEIKNLIAEGFPREIILLSVVTIPTLSVGEGIDYPALKNSRFEKMRNYLEGVRERIAAEGITVKTEILEGDAAQMINSYVKKNGVDLIVIATHGYSGMKRLMFGSVALRVLHDAQVPVLLIRPEGHREPHSGTEKG